MMEVRKKLALFVCEVTGEYQQNFINGFKQLAWKQNYDVLVFSTRLKNVLTARQNGEYTIFRLLNYNMVSGIVIAGDTFGKRQYYNDLCQHIRQVTDIPVVVVDSTCPVDFPVVLTDDSPAAYNITKHLIEKHNVKSFHVLAGMKDNHSTESRLDGISRCLQDHGLRLEPSMVTYGDFWYPSGRALATEIISGHLKLPETIICLSDHMAIGLTNELIRCNIRIPEDVIVTGFDATMDAALNNPCITSHTTNSYNCGCDAFLRLHAMITGEELEFHDYTTGKIMIGETCGCPVDLEYIRHTNLTEDYHLQVDYFNPSVTRFSMNTFINSDLDELLMDADSIEEFLSYFRKNSYYINPLKNFYLCLNEDWLGDDNPTFDQREFHSCFQDHMTIVAHIETNEGEKSGYYRPSRIGKWEGTNFRSAEMLPELTHPHEEPTIYYFSALCFSNHTLGYCVLEPQKSLPYPDNVYMYLCQLLAKSLEMLRVKSILKLHSQRDELTGIYNLEGIKQNKGEILRTALHENLRVLILFVDLNNLREINNIFGHAEGDFALQSIANVLKSCCVNAGICARLGGDEFLLLTYCEDNETPERNYIQVISDRIQEFNSRINKPYNISASIGYYCNYLNEAIPFDTMIKMADEKMYQEKAKFHKDDPEYSYLRNENR